MRQLFDTTTIHTGADRQLQPQGGHTPALDNRPREGDITQPQGGHTPALDLDPVKDITQPQGGHTPALDLDPV
ncbi:hypothetical protein ACOMHN_054133 [Nucella lapillus]